MEAVTELIHTSQSKILNLFEFSRVSPGAHPLTKKPEDFGYEIVTLGVIITDFRNACLVSVNFSSIGVSFLP